MASRNRLDVPKPDRLRKAHSKVWTGCGHCKRRHLKCDEKKPGCDRCRRANLQCNGYHPPIARIFELPNRSTSSLSEKAVAPSSEIARRSANLEVTPGAGVRTYVVPWQSESASASLFPLLETPNPSNFWHSGFLDVFLNTWLPRDLIGEASKGAGKTAGIPFSAWPSIAWRVARKHECGLVAQSILCLTLAVFAARTGNDTLRVEATRQYGSVLHRLQHEITLLARTSNSPRQDDHVASLLAAGFGCSHIEYILRSWTNGEGLWLNCHLPGINSITQACGIEHPDSQKLSLDHRLLWTSALVILRRRPEKNELVAPQAGTFNHPTQALVAIAARLASLLDERDASGGQLEAENMLDLLLQFSQIRKELEAFLVTQRSEGENQEKHEQVGQSFDLDPDLLKAAVMQGYASALLVQTATAAWQILRSKATHSVSVDGELPLTEDAVRSTCLDHVLQLRWIITELAHERYSMLTACPLLFMIDSAFTGYTALSQYHGYDLYGIREWFTKIGTYMTGLGFRPLREPWLEQEVVLIA
ncbi:hypothetical protein LTR10_011201 [Elasticomyces elasticus]|nr:hypothetical protein LTR10_011201 [Elasticomyces elasticus]